MFNRNQWLTLSLFLSRLSDSDASHSLRLFVSLLLSISVPPCPLPLTLFHFPLPLLHILLSSRSCSCTNSLCHSLIFVSSIPFIWFCVSLLIPPLSASFPPPPLLPGVSFLPRLCPLFHPQHPFHVVQHCALPLLSLSIIDTFTAQCPLYVLPHQSAFALVVALHKVKLSVVKVNNLQHPRGACYCRARFSFQNEMWSQCYSACLPDVT